MITSSCGECLKSRIPQRCVLTLLTFMAIISLYMMRICLPISMTQMVKSIASNTTAGAHELICPDGRINESGESTDDGTQMKYLQFEWSQELQGFILSSFYTGYLAMHIPAGLLAERIGGKPVVLIALIFSSMLSLLTPIAVVSGGAHGLMIIRMLLGCVQAGLFPAIATLLAVWVPKKERGRVGSIIYCAGPFGAIIGNFTTGQLLFKFNSWQVGFYTFGVVGVVISVLYAIFINSNPSTHPFISEKEKAYLKKEIGQLERDKNIKKVPWNSICTSTPVIALLLALVLGDWAYYVILIDLPKYMNDVLHVSIKDTGFYTSLPWAMFMLVSLASGILSDKVISNGHLSITNTRKLLVIVSATIDGSFLLAAVYSKCDLTLVGIFFTIAVGAQGLMSSSLLVNAMDLCPNYAGALTGAMGTFGCFMGVLVPVVISFLTPNSLQSEWKIVFYITVLAHIIQIFVYSFWGSAKIQPFNSPEGNAIEMQKPNTASEQKTTSRA